MFAIAAEFANIMGMAKGEIGRDGDPGLHPPAMQAPSSFPNSSEKGTFVLDFVSLTQIFQAGEDLAAAKAKNNLLPLF